MADNQPVTGLQTSIWNNNLKSLFLLALYPVILAAVVYACAYAVAAFGGNGQADPASFAGGLVAAYWPTILTVAAVWFVVAYFFQGSMIRSMAKSHGVTRKDEPALYNLLENLCIAQGMKMPRLEIIETHARNAFASGINESSFCVTVTRGLMQSLTRDELEAVLAHELVHIKHRDVRLLMVCVIFTGMLGIAAQLLWSNMRYAMLVPRDRNGKSGGGVMLMMVIGVILWIGYAATLFTRFAISRRREFMADAGAVQMTKNPDAMMRALIRISGMADIPKAPDDLRAMCFENRHALFGLFATHPPIEKRVQAISDYSGLPVPALAPKIRADRADSFAPPSPEGHRDNWVTRQRFASRRDKNPWV